MLRALGMFSLFVGLGTVFDSPLGAAEDMAHSSLRFGIGRFTTEAEIDFVVNHIVRVVTRLRDMRYGLTCTSVLRCAHSLLQPIVGDGAGRH